MVDYDREITHGPHEKAEQLQKSYCFLEKRISENSHMVRVIQEELERKKTFRYIDDRYLELETAKNIGPVMGIVGGAGYLISSWFLVTEPWEGIGLFTVIIACFIIIFSIVYYFTMPPKDRFLDRLNGKITYTGFFWGKNITTTFEDAIFFFSTGGDDGAGSFDLELIRPNLTKARWGIGGDCYESLSLITWYMDKNRPLPPGTAFDPYRDNDYERRKAEGFPRPLYPSDFETPEATEKQQRERKRIGGW